MTGTFFLTLFFSIETGLVASVVFSLILVIQKSTQTRIKIIGRLPGTDEWVPIDEDEAAQEDVPGVVSRELRFQLRMIGAEMQLVVRVRENLNFANTGQLKERLRRVSVTTINSSGSDFLVAELTTSLSYMGCRSLIPPMRLVENQRNR